MNTIKEALEGAKKHLYDGIEWDCNQSFYICHAAIHAIAASAGVSYVEAADGRLATEVEAYVSNCLGEYATARELAVEGRGIPRTAAAVQAFRLAFIDEMIAGLE